MAGIEVGEIDPGQFETGKTDKVPADHLNTSLLYSWFSIDSSGEARVYPSKVQLVEEQADPGVLAVRFAILSPSLEQIRTTFSLFRDGLYVGQWNGLPFFKEAPDKKGVTVEEGYFTGPIIVSSDAEVSQGMHQGGYRNSLVYA